MHWALRNDARHPNALAQCPIQPVKRRAAAREDYAACRYFVGDLWREILERALDELGHLANGPGEGVRHVGRREHHGLQPALLEVAALDVNLDLSPVGLQQGRARFNLD